MTNQPATEQSSDQPTDVYGVSLIGQRVKARRLELGLSRRALCARLGSKSGSLVEQFESTTGGISAASIVRLATALECTPDVLWPALSGGNNP